MKKILIFILCLSVQLSAQIKGDIILIKDQEIFVNKVLIEFLESQIDTVKGKSKLISWEGQTKFSIPYLQIFKKNTLTKNIKIDNKQYRAQYEVTNYGTYKNITLFNIKTKYKEFDLKNGKIKKDKDWKNNDNDSFLKPDKDKIKEKLKKIKIKP